MVKIGFGPNRLNERKKSGQKNLYQTSSQESNVKILIC